MEQMTRTDAAKRRATHQKLTRDYRLVETTYKNLKLEYTKRRHDLDRKRREILEEQERRNFKEGLGEDNARLQMELREDVSILRLCVSYCILFRMLSYLLGILSKYSA